MCCCILSFVFWCPVWFPHKTMFDTSFLSPVICRRAHVLFVSFLFAHSGVGLGLWCLTPHYFSYIVALSFIGGGNQRTRRKPPTCRKLLTNIILYQVHLTWAGFELTMLVVIGADCIGSYKSNYHAIRTTKTLFWNNRALIKKGGLGSNQPV